MFHKFVQYEKFKEYFSWDFENKFALLGTVVLVIATYFFKIYDCFDNYIEVINSLLGLVIGALIGALALILSGIVFCGSLFDRKFSESLIKYTNDELVIDKLFTSYLFLSFNILGNIVLSFVLMLAINSTVEKAGLLLFYVIEVLYVYWFLFILGYTVCIMKRGIELIQLRDEVETMGQKKTIYEIANELRIDAIFEFIYQGVPPKEMYKNLREVLNERIDLLENTKEEKDTLRKYFEGFYSVDKDNYS